jgi:hypothetical protein
LFHYLQPQSRLILVSMMQVNRLVSDELTFELAIRGIKTDGITVECKRKLLRTRLNLERCDPTEKQKYTRVEFDPELEIGICQEKLDLLSTLVNEFTKKPLTFEFDKLNTRLTHVFNRVRYIKEEDANKEKKGLLETRCLDLLDILTTISEGIEIKTNDMTNFFEQSGLQDTDDGGTVPTRENVGAAPISIQATAEPLRDSPEHTSSRYQPEITSGVHFANRLQELQFSTQTLPDVTRDVCGPTVPVIKWNLKFSGDTAKLGVNSFLERVDELKTARNMSDKQLFNSAVDLFEDQALIWYRSIKSKISDWADLVHALKLNFLPLDFDDELWSNIRSRKQGLDEKPNIFIAVMINYFNRLTQATDEPSKLKYIMKNLQPYYANHLALQTVHDIDELIVLCRRLEETRMQNANFRKAPDAIAPLDPDLVYKPPTLKRTIHSVAQPPKSSQRNDSREDRPRRSFAPMICWNCRKTGHSFRFCKETRNKFCFICGTVDEEYATCTKCNSRLPKNGLARASSSNEPVRTQNN